MLAIRHPYATLRLFQQSFIIHKPFPAWVNATYASIFFSCCHTNWNAASFFFLFKRLVHTNYNSTLSFQNVQKISLSKFLWWFKLVVRERDGNGKLQRSWTEQLKPLGNQEKPSVEGLNVINQSHEHHKQNSVHLHCGGRNLRGRDLTTLNCLQ